MYQDVISLQFSSSMKYEHREEIQIKVYILREYHTHSIL